MDQNDQAYRGFGSFLVRRAGLTDCRVLSFAFHITANLKDICCTHTQRVKIRLWLYPLAWRPKYSYHHHQIDIQYAILSNPCDISNSMQQMNRSIPFCPCPGPELGSTVDLRPQGERPKGFVRFPTGGAKGEKYAHRHRSTISLRFLEISTMCIT